MKNTFLLFCCLCILTGIKSQEIDQCSEVQGFFSKIPLFNATCGIVVSAEQVHLLVRNQNAYFDTIDCFILCSERFLNSKIELNREYIFKTIKTDLSDFDFKIYGIKETKNEVIFIDDFW